MNKWIVTLEEDPETGDLILPLSDEVLEGTGWKTGDTLEWIDNKDGTWTLKKKETKMKFTFIAEHESGEKITYETEKDFLQDVLSDFELFLRGAGFYFDGQLGFVEEDVYQLADIDYDSGPLEEYFGENAGAEEKPVVTEHSEYYYDTERNKEAAVWPFEKKE
jgi:bifunctional DNA-binding transcriptional regulator/antitoxin component of YhaV-PrlF toxin-antitoxin module